MLKNHNSRGFFICLMVTVFVLVFYLKGWFDALESKAVDFRFNWRGDRPANQDIVVIAADEESIVKLGRWPWPRQTHADLIYKLAKAGAKVVAFDVLFTEPDRSNPASDAALANAVRNTGLVVSSFFFQEAQFADIIAKKPLFPYPALKNAGMFGFVNSPPDPDGVTRHAPLYYIGDDGETVYPSLTVAALALAQGKGFDEVLPTLPVHIDADFNLAENKLFVNYAYSKTTETYPMYSYVDVLNGTVDLEKSFKGKIVFVGGTATALFDMLSIPFASLYAGVLVHANVLDNLLTGNYLRVSGIEFTIVYVLVLGLLLGYLLPRLPIWAKFLTFVVLVGGGVVLGWVLFSTKNLVIPMVPPFVAGVGCYGGILLYRLIIEEREKRKIKGNFKQYLSPKIIDIITKDPSKMKLGGEEREVSIFFLDIAGFTTMSEALKPTQLVEVMNQCLTKFSKIILKHDGLINKYIGDCIMAFWNAPIDQKKHASFACWAALDCIAALNDLNRDFQSKGLPHIDCRVGINTGTVVVGNMGSLERFDYTVMGDAVNLASRFEGANKEYHSHIMVSDVTFDQAKDDIEARDLDLIRVKGKKEPRKVFEVLCKKGEMSEELRLGRNKYHEALKLYRQRQFDEAIHVFEEVFQYLPNDHLTRKYLERARTFKVSPPPTVWDGVFEMKSK